MFLIVFGVKKFKPFVVNMKGSGGQTNALHFEICPELSVKVTQLTPKETLRNKIQTLQNKSMNNTKQHLKNP